MICPPGWWTNRKIISVLTLIVTLTLTLNPLPNPLTLTPYPAPSLTLIRTELGPMWTNHRFSRSRAKVG